MIKKEKIIGKYKGKLLGVCNYREKGGDFYVADFLDRTSLIDFLYELESHESTLTEFGYSFLEEYYGFDKIADMLLEENPDYPFNNKEDLIKWLRSAREWAIEK